MTELQEKGLTYLKALNPSDVFSIAKQCGVSDAEVGGLPASNPLAWDADKCIDCLQTFIGANIWLGYLFNRGDVWVTYLKSVAEERYWKSLELVCQSNSPSELLDYLNVAYKFGQEVIPNQEYDSLEELYLSVYPYLAESRKNRTADDVSASPLIMDAIRMSGIKRAKDAPKTAKVTGKYASLNAEKSTSIKPVRSYQEAFEFLQAATPCSIHWSLKMDGFNTKCVFEQGKLAIALSRGRSADSWDYTEAVRRIMEANGVDASQIDGKVTGETLVDADGLLTLREKYPDKNYKTPKSTAGAMLRAPQNFEVEDYKWLRFFPFEISEVKKPEAFRQLREAGFNPPPDLITEWPPMASLEEFSVWLDKNVLDVLWEAGGKRRDMSDGVVLQLLTDVESDRADKYSDLNIALKFSHWTEAEYEAKVTDIIFEQQRVHMSVVLVIEPTTTRDLNIATRVSIGSPAILVHDGVKVGDVIRFARKSEAINIYLGKR